MAKMEPPRLFHTIEGGSWCAFGSAPTGRTALAYQSIYLVVVSWQSGRRGNLGRVLMCGMYVFFIAGAALAQWCVGAAARAAPARDIQSTDGIARRHTLYS